VSTNGRPLPLHLITALALVSAVSGANAADSTSASRRTKFEWPEQRLSARPLVVGETTWQDVTQRLLGPTYHVTGDGGDPRQLCYLLRSAEGSNVRVVLSFFGSAEGGVLAAIEWQAMTTPLDPWIGRVCRRPSLGAVGTGIDSGIKLGDSRSKVRQALGVPTTSSARRDDYARVSRHGIADRSTKLTLLFDARDLLVTLEVQQIETN
jgi:hypothetical protein